MSTTANIRQIGDLAADLDDPIGRLKHFIAALDAMIYLVHDDDHEGNPRGLQSTLWDMLHLTRDAQEELSEAWKKLMDAFSGDIDTARKAAPPSTKERHHASPARDAVLAWERLRTDYLGTEWTEKNNASMEAMMEGVDALEEIAKDTPCRSLRDANALLRLAVYGLELHDSTIGPLVKPIKSVQRWMVGELDGAPTPDAEPDQ